MTENEAIDVIKQEKQCVLRNGENGCDRDCICCDLIMEDNDIICGYDTAIKALKEIKKYHAIGTIEECRKALNKLAEYEDLEKQGRLLKLPCKIGDMLYYPDKLMNKIHQNCAEKIEVDSSGIYVIDTSGWVHSSKGFGETTFPTKTEAEQAMQKAKEETNDQ